MHFTPGFPPFRRSVPLRSRHPVSPRSVPFPNLCDFPRSVPFRRNGTERGTGSFRRNGGVAPFRSVPGIPFRPVLFRPTISEITPGPFRSVPNGTELRNGGTETLFYNTETLFYTDTTASTLP